MAALNLKSRKNFSAEGGETANIGERSRSKVNGQSKAEGRRQKKKHWNHECTRINTNKRGKGTEACLTCRVADRMPRRGRKTRGKSPNRNGTVLNYGAKANGVSQARRFRTVPEHRSATGQTLFYELGPINRACAP